MKKLNITIKIKLEKKAKAIAFGTSRKIKQGEKI